MADVFDEAAAGLLRARDELQQRLADVNAALVALDVNSDAPRRIGKQAIGDDKLELVRAYILRNGRVRQAEIGAELGLNSGTVSVALGRLEQAGEIVQGAKQNRSQTWEPVK